MCVCVCVCVCARVRVCVCARARVRVPNICVFQIYLNKIPEIAWSTQVNHILSRASVYCSTLHHSKRLSFIIYSIYLVTAIAMLLSILGISWNVISVTSVMFLREGALWCPVWMKHTLHVFIALNKGQAILCWVKIIPLSTEMLSRHDIILVFPGFSKFFVAQKKHSNVPRYQNQTKRKPEACTEPWTVSLHP